MSVKQALHLTLNDLGDIQEEILKASTKWYNIGLKLRVAVHVLDAIKLLPPGNFGDQLLEMLKYWLKTAQFPTWKELIGALRAPAVGEFWLASELEKKYCCTGESEPGVQSGLGQHRRQSSLGRVEKMVTELERKFHNLVDRVRESVKDIPVDQFRNTITLLPASMRDEHCKFLKENIPQICKATTINEIFCWLNLYWDYLNFGLLEYIVSVYGNAVMKEMKEYTEEVKVFREETPLGIFWNVQPRRHVDIPPDLKEVISKHDEGWSNFTLEQVEEFRQEFAAEYSLYNFAIVLAKIEMGSVIITWLVPSSIATNLRDEIQEGHDAILKKRNVLTLTVDGVSVYETTQAPSVSQPDGESAIPSNSSGIPATPTVQSDTSILEEVNLVSEFAVSLGQQKIADALKSALSKAQLTLPDQFTVGLVGLRKSGKSTLLNALIRKAMLPVPLQLQTTVSVHVVHNPAYPDGRLVIDHWDDQPSLIEVGAKSIHKYLLDLNRDSDPNDQFKRLTLHAPLPFLMQKPHIPPLEIHDAPGGVLGSAHHASLIAGERSPLVVVLSYRALFLQSEIDDLKQLKLLCKKHQLQDGILYLVNGIDAFYLEWSEDEKSITPDIRSYTAQYLQKNIDISVPESQIVPLSAKWGMKSRMWADEPVSMVKEYFLEAAFLLLKAGYIDTIPEATLATKLSICEMLEEFSGILTAEMKLLQLLEKFIVAPTKNAVDTTLDYSPTLQQVLQEKIADQKVKEKEEAVADLQAATLTLQELKEASIQHFQQLPKDISDAIQPQVSVTVESLKSSLSGLVATMLISQLNIHGKEDHEMVVTQISSVKTQLPDQAKTKMERSWFVVAQLVASLIRGKLEFLSSKIYMNAIKTAAATGISPLPPPPTTCTDVPQLPTFQMHLSSKDSEVVSNEQLQKCIVQSSTPKAHPSGHVSQVPIFYPDLPALLETFMPLISTWIHRFHSHVQSEITKVSQEASTSASELVSRVIEDQINEIQGVLKIQKEELESSTCAVASLEEKSKQIQQASHRLKLWSETELSKHTLGPFRRGSNILNYV